jgi:hypothetical protein
MDTRIVVIPLRALLVVTFAGLLLLQALSLPGQFAHMAREHPEDAGLRWPLLAITVLGLACVQVVIVATWRLLTLVAEDRIFSERAFVWVDVILGAVAAAWALLVTLFFIAVAQGDPGLPILILITGLGVGVFGLVMVVMRALLRQAAVLRSDMEAVI